MNIKMILTTAVVASGLSLWGEEACKGPECPNMVNLDLSTVQSWDPNEMRGPDGVGANRYVQAGDWMDYTIYFENRAEATAAAQEVFVTLPKDPSLDWDTLELGEVAFGANIDSGLNGKANGESTYYLTGSDGQVRTKVTVTDTEVKWYLRSWDPHTIDNFPADATAGFLPPNDATGRGEGHVRYRVRVKSSVAMGTVARACATIVFDQNEAITTDPAWWNTIGVMQQVTMVVDGVTTNLNVFVGMPYGELPSPGQMPNGYSFGGWFTGEGGTGREVTATTPVEFGVSSLYAKWNPNEAIVTFEGHGTVVSVTDGIITIPGEVKRIGYKFSGWSDAQRIYQPGDRYVVPAGGKAFVPVYALKMLTDDSRKHVNVDAGEVAPYEKSATVYDGYLLDDGKIVGTIQVKVAKGKTNKKKEGNPLEAKVTATVQLAGGAKKISFKGGVADATGTVTGLTAKDHRIENVSLGVYGLGGTFDGKYMIDGVRNIFSGKTPEDKADAAEAMRLYQGTYNIVFDNGVLSVTVGKKGKTKVSGTVGETKMTATSQLLVGDGVAAIPVVVYKAKKFDLAFRIMFADDVSVEGLEDVRIGEVGSLNAGSHFVIDAVAVTEFVRKLPGLYSQLPDGASALPDGVSVAQNGKKWVVADGAKAGKLVLLDKTTGELDMTKSKITANTAGLKLTYKSADGSFKGSFKVYAFEKGKIKSYTANVTGVMIGDKGYGAATIKKVGSVSVTIE